MTLVLRATVTVVPARRRPIADGYRASMWFDARVSAREGWTPVVHDAVLVWEDRAAGVARLYPVLPEELPRDLAPDRPFALVDATRPVARAVLLALAADRTPSPLADLAAAGRRTLCGLRSDPAADPTARPGSST
jgi:hypothetical protein